MEIPDIKSQLTIANVLHYYSLKPDKSSKMCCPFHEDKTPSMQIYYKTQTAYCFSSNCKTHGKSMDVIDFIMYKENCTKHEAIKKAEDILNPTTGNKEISREQFLTNMFTYFRNAINNFKPAKEYLEKRGLDFTRIEIGYNSGQFHHGERKTEELLKQALEVGLLQDKGQINTRTGEKGFSPFVKWCICFALRNRKNEVTGLYFRSSHKYNVCFKKIGLLKIVVCTYFSIAKRNIISIQSNLFLYELLTLFLSIR
ncbi:CHC2 zinc finger domain-containing protein [Chryseobacterium artocarpi]|uniref:CHC2 zinc finger domain-containing protein n=1 Tax=Chryseobacterium artocarpi TaxID=1414727 RepID=UPI003F3C3A02